MAIWRLKTGSVWFIAIYEDTDYSNDNTHACNGDKKTAYRWWGKKELACMYRDHWKKKLSHFNLKSWVIDGTKIRPGFRVIGEYSSQIDSILRVNSKIDSQYQIDSNVSIWLKYSPITWNPGSNFSSASDSIF